MMESYFPVCFQAKVNSSQELGDTLETDGHQNPPNPEIVSSAV